MEPVKTRPEDTLFNLLEQLRQQLADLRTFAMSADLSGQPEERVDRSKTVTSTQNESTRFA